MVHVVSKPKIRPSLPTGSNKTTFGIHKASKKSWLDEIDEEMKLKEKEIASAEKELHTAEVGLEKAELEREKRLLLKERKEELEREKERLALEKEHLLELEEKVLEKIEKVKPAPAPTPVIIEERPKEPIMPKIEEGLKKVGKVAKAVPEVLFGEEERKKQKKWEKFKKESGVRWV